MAALEITLPAFNGILDIGLAIGTDPGLPDDRQLSIRETSTMRTKCGYAAAWAWHTSQNADRSGRVMYAAGAIARGAAGFCRPVGANRDSDWKTIPDADVDAKITDRCPEECYSEENLRKALTLIMYAKANCWSMNHHTGRDMDHGKGYVGKAIEKRTGRDSTREWVNCAHTVGHWASAIHLYTLAHIDGIRRCADPPEAPNIPVDLSIGAPLRLTGALAETHRNAEWSMTTRYMMHF